MVRRAVLAGLAGLILPVSLLAWSIGLALFVQSDNMCGLLGCLGYLSLAWRIGRWVALVLAWPLLHLLGVRPAAPVALVGAALWWESGRSSRR